MSNHQFTARRFIALMIGVTAMAGLANAALVTYPAGGPVFEGGTATIDFNTDFLVGLTVAGHSFQGNAPATATAAIDHAGNFPKFTKLSIVMPFNSITVYDDDPLQLIVHSTTAGSVTEIQPDNSIGIVQQPGSLTISNLDFFLPARVVYADIVGANGVGSRLKVPLWHVSQVDPATIQIDASGPEPEKDITQILSGLSLSTVGLDIFKQSLGLSSIAIPLFAAQDIGSITIVSRFHDASVVPEPPLWALIGAGLPILGLRQRLNRARPRQWCGRST